MKKIEQISAADSQSLKLDLLQKQITGIMAVSSPDYGEITSDFELRLTYNGGKNKYN